MYYPPYFPAVRPQVNQYMAPQLNIENTPQSLITSPKPAPQSFQPGSYKIGSTGISIKPLQSRENIQPLQQIQPLAQNTAITSLPAVPVAEKQNTTVIPKSVTKPVTKPAEPTHEVRKVLQSLRILFYFVCFFILSLIF